MPVYIYQRPEWPRFKWDETEISSLLNTIVHQQGKLLGQMERLGFSLQAEATLETLTLEILKSNEIEGEILDAKQVRSSVAKRLGIEIAGITNTDRYIDGIVQMMLDATQQYEEPLTAERLYGWHTALFPTGRSGIHTIVTGDWRNNLPNDPMQVVSGPLGKEKIHYEAPAAELLPDEMQKFLQWFNLREEGDPILKAAIAHLWFVTIHPFDDGNGRMARALADMLLARADGTLQRFYSMSAQIRKERNAYYDILEETQRGELDITGWLQWFLHCLGRAINTSEKTLASVLSKATFWGKNEKTILNERQVSMLNKLLDGFEGKLTTSKWARITKTSADTALRDIQDLVSKNILVKEEAGGRSTSYGLKKFSSS